MPSKNVYLVTITVHVDGYEKTTRHLVTAADEAEAEEITIAGECHHDDAEPCLQSGLMKDGIFAYELSCVSLVAPEDAPTLAKYLGEPWND